VKLFATAEHALPPLDPDLSLDDESVTLDGPHRSVLSWLGRLRLLHGVPFTYLVPDDGLLRPESIRFFHLDRRWTDALVEGALSVGTFDTRERAALQKVYPRLRGVVDDAERAARLEPPSSPSPSANVTGLLLRSGAVSGWPGLHVAATRDHAGDHREVRLLRMERLAPAVLLVLFEDIPDQVVVAEPSAGIQFGAQWDGDSDRWVVPVRDPGKADGSLRPDEPRVDVPFRKGSSGVVHVTELLKRLGAEGGIAETALPSASLALQLLRQPYLQPFGPGPVGRPGTEDPRPWRVRFDLTSVKQAVEAFTGAPR
jgi:hypothetical protein